jgi:hypothetical protein
MFNRFKSKPVVYERDKKVTLVGETDSEGKLFITGYRKEESTMSAETPKVDIGSAGTLTPPFPSGVEPIVAEVPIATDTNAEVPVVVEPNAEVPVATDTNIVDSNTEVVPAPDASVPPPPKPPKPETMAPVSPLFTEQMQEGGRKSRRNKKTGKKQKGGKLRRKSRKQRR